MKNSKHPSIHIAALIGLCLLAAHSAIGADVQPYQAKQVQPYQAKTTQPYQAPTTQPYQAPTTQPYQAPTTQPYHAKPLQPTPKGHCPNDVGHLVGRWQTNVSGAAYTTEDAAGNRYMHTSAGARAGQLVINPNGTYVWAAWGGKKGRWVKGSKSWPIVLIDNQEHKKWGVACNESSGGKQIYIWDGQYYTYNGRR